MASQEPTTRIQSPPPPPAPPRSDRALDPLTLVLSAIASAVAAYVTSRLWTAGTLWAAAMSPVIVALVKEGLRKPTEVVTAAVPSPRARTRTRSAELPDDLSEQLEAGAPPPFPPPEPGAAEGPVRVYRPERRRLRWKVALVTGLLAFAACVVFFTVPELVTGRSVGSPGRATTLWGGTSRHHRSTTTPTQTTGTTTATTPAQTQPQQTVTQPQEQTQTTPSTATPQSTATPPATTTPQQTTPVAPTGDGQTPPAQ